MTLNISLLSMLHTYMQCHGRSSPSCPPENGGGGGSQRLGMYARELPTQDASYGTMRPHLSKLTSKRHVP